MTNRVHIDFETRSAVDIRTAGAWNYAKHESTDVLCMAYAINDGPVRLWTKGDDWPKDLDMAIGNAWPVYAHNAFFERVLWAHVMTPRYGWPRVCDSAWRCTMAQGRAHGLPGALEHACKAAGLEQQKDMEGKKLMLKMCKPIPRPKK